MAEHTLYVKGLHCKTCLPHVDAAAAQLPYVTGARTDLVRQSVTLEGDFSSTTPEAIAAELTHALRAHGYQVTVEREAAPTSWGEFLWAVPIALFVLLGFVFLQRLGVVNLVDASSMTVGTAFLIGLVASVSTCMAVVGGLVLSMSATFAKEGSAVQPQLLFHGGRLLSFVVLGGVVGALGSAFALNTTATIVLSIIIAVVMLVLGLNLLEVTRVTKHLQPSLPRSAARLVHGLAGAKHSLTPFLVGVVTFFLPCGFTQSMQIYTLSTGSFTAGALTMGAFALGTLPVLALLSFSSFSVHNSVHRGVFFKSAGLIVIAFALYNALNALVIAGLVPPLLGF